MICAWLTCMALLAQEPMPQKKRTERTKACVNLARLAQSHSLDPLTVSVIAYRESRFSDESKSDKGAVGILQVIPKYWCPNGKAKGCDLTKAGLKAWQTYRKKRSRREAFCRYSTGKKCKDTSAGRAYAKALLKTRKQVTQFLNAAVPWVFTLDCRHPK